MGHPARKPLRIHAWAVENPAGANADRTCLMALHAPDFHALHDAALDAM